MQVLYRVEAETDVAEARDWYRLPRPRRSTASRPDGFVVDAAVEFLDFEGGCWAVRTSDRTRYEPLDLGQEFRRDGLEIRAALKPRNDVGSCCAFGPRVEILWIRRR